MILKFPISPGNARVDLTDASSGPWETSPKILSVRMQDGELVAWIDTDAGSMGADFIDFYFFRTGEDVVLVPGLMYVDTVQIPGEFVVHIWAVFSHGVTTPPYSIGMQSLPFGRKPIEGSMVPLDTDSLEMMHYMYCPISFPGQDRFTLPDPRTHPFANIIFWANSLFKRSNYELAEMPIEDLYVYLTAKVSWVGPGSSANRPGWHGDGFGSDDVNVIWYDFLPTLFAEQPFWISDHDVKSMRQFEEQVRPESIVRYSNKTLLALDQHVVHAVDDNPTEAGRRTFIKISYSRHKYNLVGNTHNHNLDYEWEMFDRAALRNDPINGERDFVLP